MREAKYIILAVALLGLTPVPMRARADNGNRPFVGIWKTERVNGQVVEGGACAVSPDGSTLTITDQAPGRKAIFVQVFDRQK
jgi:hypothetical protein